MKSKYHISITNWQRLFIAVHLISLLACQKEKIEPPVITEVINYAASPNDTIVQTIQTGQWVVLRGENLSKVTQVFFSNTPAALNATYCTDSNIVVQVPSISFQSVAKEQWNELIVVNEAATVSFPINIIGPPFISHIRNYDAAPNDTLTGLIIPGQHINIIGYHLNNAISITFQGLEADLSQVVYTDSSAIVKVPEDFSDGDAKLANKINYTNAAGTSTFSIPIFDPAVLDYYNDPLFVLLTGGIGQEKTWAIDFNAEGKSSKFLGPLYFSGVDYGWNNQCNFDGGDCWLWEAEYQTWMPAPGDYGTMTFMLSGNPVEPVVKVNQLVIENAGTFSGTFFFDIEAKTITFIDIVPLNLGWAQIWSTAYVISLTDDGMQLAFRHTEKVEFEIYNFVPKK